MRRPSFPFSIVAATLVVPLFIALAGASSYLIVRLADSESYWGIEQQMQAGVLAVAAHLEQQLPEPGKPIEISIAAVNALESAVRDAGIDAVRVIAAEKNETLVEISGATLKARSVLNAEAEKGQAGSPGASAEVSAPADVPTGVAMLRGLESAFQPGNIVQALTGVDDASGTRRLIIEASYRFPELVSARRRLQKALVVAAIIVCGFGALAAYLMSRRVRSDFNQLTRGAQRAVEGALPSSQTALAVEETEDLFATIETMASLQFDACESIRREIARQHQSGDDTEAVAALDRYSAWQPLEHGRFSIDIRTRSEGAHSFRCNGQHGRHAVVVVGLLDPRLDPAALVVEKSAVLTFFARAIAGRGCAEALTLATRLFAIELATAIEIDAESSRARVFTAQRGQPARAHGERSLGGDPLWIGSETLSGDRAGRIAGLLGADSSQVWPIFSAVSADEYLISIASRREATP